MAPEALRQGGWSAYPHAGGARVAGQADQQHLGVIFRAVPARLWPLLRLSGRASLIKSTTQKHLRFWAIGQEGSVTILSTCHSAHDELFTSKAFPALVCSQIIGGLRLRWGVFGSEQAKTNFLEHTTCGGLIPDSAPSQDSVLNANAATSCCDSWGLGTEGSTWNASCGQWRQNLPHVRLIGSAREKFTSRLNARSALLWHKPTHSWLSHLILSQFQTERMHQDTTNYSMSADVAAFAKKQRVPFRYHQEPP